MGFARHQVDRTLRGVGRSDRERASADDDAVVAVVAYLAPRDGRAFPCLTAVDAVGVARTQAGPDALRHGASVYDAVSVLVGVALLLEKREGVGPVYRDVFEFGVVALVEHDGMDAGVRLVGLDVHDHQIPDLLACAPRSVLDGPEEVVTELFECGVVARVGGDAVALEQACLRIVELHAVGGQTGYGIPLVDPDVEPASVFGYGRNLALRKAERIVVDGQVAQLHPHAVVKAERLLLIVADDRRSVAVDVDVGQVVELVRPVVAHVERVGAFGYFDEVPAFLPVEDLVMILRRRGCRETCGGTENSQFFHLNRVRCRSSSAGIVRSSACTPDSGSGFCSLRVRAWAPASRSCTVCNCS